MDDDRLFLFGNIFAVIMAELDEEDG